MVVAYLSSSKLVKLICIFNFCNRVKEVMKSGQIFGTVFTGFEVRPKTHATRQKYRYEVTTICFVQKRLVGNDF